MELVRSKRSNRIHKISLGSPRRAWGDRWKAIEDGRLFQSYVNFILRRHGRPHGWSWDDWYDEVHQIAITTVLELGSSRIEVESHEEWTKRVKREINRRVEKERRAARKMRGFADDDHSHTELFERDLDRIDEIERERRALEQAMSELGRKERGLIKSYYQQGKSQAEIGREFGVSQSTMSRRIQRVERWLRSRIEDILIADA